ncbi:vWA domain-containing protein [Anaerofustis butyriciformans]|uniref:vWA domain-containing protein n=1 Tax=Anaerofustis butyriciformans TaxID=3108533 RepID=UPI002E2F7582|nr:vWA domain-containing protein [Anaerofustis sp. HA2171]
MKKIFALILCGFIMLSLVSPVSASNTTINTNKIIVSEELYNNGEQSQVGNIPTLEEQLTDLNGTISAGEVTGSKNGYFENEKDKEERTVKINIDLTAKGVQTESDTIFILDESGSMGSYTSKTEDGLGINGGGASPCQNVDHYYKVEKGKYGATEDTYFKLSDYMALPFNGWSSSIFTKVNSDLGLNLIADRSTITYLIDNHYCKKSDGSYTHIPPDYTSMGSPRVDNPYGCIDKGNVAHAGIWNITKNLIESNPNNRVAFVSFCYTLRDNVDFSNDLDMLEPILKDTQLALGTDYGTGFSAAKALIEKRESTDVPLNVIFISDGMPTDSFTVNNANYKYIKSLPNTKIYTINIMSSASTLLSNMASSSELYSYCADLDELNNVFSSLADSLSGYPKMEVTDVIDKGFTLRVDSEHPITIDGVEYTNIADIPADIATISEDQRTLTFTPEIVTEKGYRISFYESLNTEALNKEDIAGTYYTNEKCDITYKKLNIDGGTITEDSEFTTISLPSPEYKIVTTVIDDGNNGNNNGNNSGNSDNTSNNNDIQGGVKTSDESNIYLYVILLGVSIFGMGYALRKKFVK